MRNFKLTGLKAYWVDIEGNRWEYGADADKGLMIDVFGDKRVEIVDEGKTIRMRDGCLEYVWNVVEDEQKD